MKMTNMVIPELFFYGIPHGIYESGVNLASLQDI